MQQCGSEERMEKAHCLAVPFQAEGHVKGMLGLAQAMSAMGVMVTFVYPARFHALASKHGTHLPRNSRLHMEVAEDGLPLEEDHSLTAELLQKSIPIFHSSVKLILDRLTQVSASAWPLLSCIIADCVSPWTKELADAVMLPHIPFWTSTAASFSMSAYLPLLISNGHLPVKKDCWAEGKRWMLQAPAVECIPGLPPFPVTDLPSEFVQAETLSDPSLKFLAAAFECMKGAPSILVHSVFELESQVLDVLRTQGFAVEAIGPLLNHSVDQRSKHESLQWLDMQPASSVIYVALGTVSHLTAAETLALALGLEASGHPFLWVIRPDAVLPSLPEGRGSAGIILSWVPQEEVLRHSSIGAFFSHCGWNSTLESMWEGVPMVACPLGMEQRSNARRIVEHWKMGVELKRQVDGSFTKEAVQEALQKVMKETYRKGAACVKEIMRHTMRESGTSHSNLIGLRQLLCRLCSQSTQCRRALS